jgi:hypothetical protein
MSRRKEQRQNFPAEADAIVDKEIQKDLMLDNQAMEDVNIHPRAHTLEEKAEIAQHLNWDMKMALRKQDITGTFIVGKTEDQEMEDCGIYLKPNDEQ